jgi:hypothetical protein
LEEHVVALAMGEDQPPIELLVILGQLEPGRIRHVGIEVPVARQGSIAPVDEKGVAAEVLRSLPAQEVQEHRLVIPHQERAGALLREPHQHVDDPLGVGSAVDVVADEEEPVVGFQGQPRQQLLQHLALAVDVSDGVEHRQPPSNASSAPSR